MTIQTNTQNNLNDITKFEKKTTFLDLFRTRGHIKVIYSLTKTDIINITELGRLTKMNLKVVSKCLDLFVKIGFVREINCGRNRLYSLCLENHKAKAIKNFVEFLDFAANV